MARKSKQPKSTTKSAGMDRRSFIGTLAAAGTGAVAGGLSLGATPAKAETVHFSNPPGLGGGGPFRSECDIRDCEVEGEIPLNIDGAFYRVGPDWQYPPMKGNIPFDGEGHVACSASPTAMWTSRAAIRAPSASKPRQRRAAAFRHVPQSLHR